MEEVKDVKDDIGLEHKIFPTTFFVLKFIGFWKPTTIKNPCLRLCYSFYTVFAATAVSLFFFGCLLEILLSKDNFLDNFVENWFLTAIVSHTLTNGLNVAVKRKDIIDMLENKMVIDRWTNLRSAEEKKIIENSRNIEHKILKYWLSLAMSTSAVNILNPVIFPNPDNNLIMNSWIPCDKNITSCFWMCYSQQSVSYLFASITNVSSCTLILNIIERICAHIRILQCRLLVLPDLVRAAEIVTAEDESSYLSECILAHQNIYSLVYYNIFILLELSCTAKQLSSIFYVSMCMQFVLIFSILCTNIFLLSSLPMGSSAFMGVALFLCCMLSQFFLFCWWGYKLTEASIEIGYTVFSIDWLELRKETRERLRFILLSTSRSIPLFDNFVVELSPEMFLKLLKISYSAFNLLQTQS